MGENILNKPFNERLEEFQKKLNELMGEYGLYLTPSITANDKYKVEEVKEVVKEEEPKEEIKEEAIPIEQ